MIWSDKGFCGWLGLGSLDGICEADRAARRGCTHVPVNWQAVLWRKQYHMFQRHSGAFFSHSCLHIKTNSGYPWFPLTVTLRRVLSKRTHTTSLQLMKEIQEWKARLGKQTIGNTSQQQNYSVVPSSHKTCDPDEAFQAEMQHGPPPLNPKKKYIHLATKSTQYTPHMCLTWYAGVPW